MKSSTTTVEGLRAFREASGKQEAWYVPKESL